MSNQGKGERKVLKQIDRMSNQGKGEVKLLMEINGEQDEYNYWSRVLREIFRRHKCYQRITEISNIKKKQIALQREKEYLCDRWVKTRARECLDAFRMHLSG